MQLKEFIDLLKRLEKDQEGPERVSLEKVDVASLMTRLAKLLNYAHLEDMLEALPKADLFLIIKYFDLIAYWLEQYPDELNRVRYKGKEFHLSKINALLDIADVCEKIENKTNKQCKAVIDALKGRFDLIKSYSYYLENKPHIDYLPFFDTLLPMAKIPNIFHVYANDYFERYFVPLLRNELLFSAKKFREQLTVYLKKSFPDLEFREAFYEIICQPECPLLKSSLPLLYQLVNESVQGLFSLSPAIVSLIEKLTKFEAAKFDQSKLVSICKLAPNGILSYTEMEQQTFILPFLPAMSEHLRAQLPKTFSLVYEDDYFSVTEVKFFMKLLSYAISGEKEITPEKIVECIRWIKKHLSTKQMASLLDSPHLGNLTIYYNSWVRELFDKAIDEKVHKTDDDGYLSNALDLFLPFPQWLIHVDKRTYKLLLVIPYIKLFTLNKQAGLIFCFEPQVSALLKIMKSEEQIEAFFVNPDIKNFYRSELILLFLSRYPFLALPKYVFDIHTASDGNLQLLADTVVCCPLLEIIGHNNPQLIIHLLRQSYLTRETVFSMAEGYKQKLSVGESVVKFETSLQCVSDYMNYGINSKNTSYSLSLCSHMTSTIQLESQRRFWVNTVAGYCADFTEYYKKYLPFFQRNDGFDVALTLLKAEGLIQATNDNPAVNKSVGFNPVYRLYSHQISFLKDICRLFESLDDIEKNESLKKFIALYKQLPQADNQTNIIILLIIKSAWQKMFAVKNENCSIDEFYRQFSSSPIPYFLSRLLTGLSLNYPLPDPVYQLVKSIIQMRNKVYYYPNQMEREPFNRFINPLFSSMSNLEAILRKHYQSVYQFRYLWFPLCNGSIPDILSYFSDVTEYFKTTSEHNLSRHTDFIFIHCSDSFDFNILRFIHRQLCEDRSTSLIQLLAFIKKHFDVRDNADQCELDFIGDKNFQDAITKFSSYPEKRLNYLKQLQGKENKLFVYRMMLTHEHHANLAKAIPLEAIDKLWFLLPNELRNCLVVSEAYDQFFTILHWAFQYFTLNDLIDLSYQWDPEWCLTVNSEHPVENLAPQVVEVILQGEVDIDGINLDGVDLAEAAELVGVNQVPQGGHPEPPQNSKFFSYLKQFYKQESVINKIMTKAFVDEHKAVAFSALKAFFKHFPVISGLATEDRARYIFNAVGQNIIYLVNMENDSWKLLMDALQTEYENTKAYQQQRDYIFLSRLLTKANMWQLMTCEDFRQLCFDKLYRDLLFFLTANNTTSNQFDLEEKICQITIEDIKLIKFLHGLTASDHGYQNVVPLLNNGKLKLPFICPIALWRKYWQEGNKIKIYIMLNFIITQAATGYFLPTKIKCLNGTDSHEAIMRFLLLASNDLLITINTIAGWEKSAACDALLLKKLTNSFLKFCNSLTLEQLLALKREDLIYLRGEITEVSAIAPQCNNLLLLNILDIHQLGQFCCFSQEIQTCIISALATHYNFDDCRVLYLRLVGFGIEKIPLNLLTILFSDLGVLVAAKDISEKLFSTEVLPKLIEKSEASKNEILNLLENSLPRQNTGNNNQESVVDTSQQQTSKPPAWRM